MALASDADFTVLVSSAAGALGAQTTSYHNLSSNATYYFKVKVSAEDDGAYSAFVSSATPPVLPLNVSLVKVDISSLTVQWAGGNNAPGSWYQAEAAIDEGFTLNTVLSSGAATMAVFENLNPNTSWYLRVKTLGFGGQDSEFNTYGSTITLTYPPASEAYALVSSTGMSVIWDDNGNPPGTVYEITVSTDGFVTVNYSSVTSGNYYEAAGLLPNATHYFKAASINGSGLRSEFTVFAATPTYSAVPAPNPPALGVPTATSVPAQWLPNGNPNYTEYYVQASTAADFTGIDYGPLAWFAAPSYTVASLESGRLYYFRARSRDFLNRVSGWLALGSKTTNAGADTTPPSVIDLQGGDVAWRGAAGGAYMVHFSDLGSGLDRFEVKVTTGPAFTGELISDWTTAVTGLSGEPEYNADWVLPAAVFEAIQENVTSYVSVRVYDTAANATTAPDVFYVKRDLTQPNIVNNAASPQGWLTADPGAVFDVDFNDALAGLGQVLYSASNQPNTASANVVAWTAVAGFTPGPAFTALWGVNFGLLADGASNYISVRAVDAAGNTRTLSDVFRILKNTVGPAVSITSPAGAYVSTATALSGSAAPMNEASAVVSNQVAIQELTGGLYYDGTAFNSAAEIWLGAQGLNTWSYNASTVPFAAGTQYKVMARSRDVNAFVTPMPYPNTTFQLDQAAPAVYISTPIDTSDVYAFNEVSGTAADTGGAGLAGIDLYVKRVVDGKWWNFAAGSWGDVAVASATLPGAAWGFTPGTLLRGALAHGQDFFVTAVSRDAAVPANSSSFGAAGSTFTWVDTTAPEPVAQFAPSTGTAPGRINLAWTFPGDDGGGFPLTYGQFAVQYSTFSSAVFSTQAAQVLISTAMALPGAAQAYTVAGLIPETTYYLAIWTKDDADFWSAISPLAQTLSGESLNNMISGTVKTPAGTGVTGVVVEAISGDGVPIASAYTLDDGNGTFTLDNLDDGFYRVQATWIQDGFSSSIAKDLIPMGYADTNFVLAIEYQLASVSGILPLSSPAGFVPSSAGGARAQLWQGSRMVAAAVTDPAGRFSIRNLIPGNYTLRVAQADGAWKTFELKLTPGQNLEVKPLGALLKDSSVYAFPNPARAFVKFHAETSVAAHIRLSVYSLDGTLVKAVEEAVPGSGVYEYTWNFTGDKPASGVYFYNVKLKHDLSGETDGETRKFAVIR
ncbi:MAG: hypothetical protein A2X35_11395 [Elusimicrobia bacterium GWA2_61_42]|nr:MAG: hypothetical protein A2X35_11395 [Elusimicrobia bacterium GWA2_61_42]OGR75857.1 MAG: hypothetical protein A2X38_07520 [Elusimicrobia bacterium GWC2_61_25]